MLIELDLPVEQFHKPMWNFSMTSGFILINIPINVPPLSYLDFLPRSINLVLATNTFKKETLESRNSEESNGDAYLQIAS